MWKWRYLAQKLIGQGHEQAQLFHSVMILEVSIPTYKENVLYYLIKLCLLQNIRLNQRASLHFSMLSWFTCILCWEISIKSKFFYSILSSCSVSYTFLKCLTADTGIFSYMLLFFGSIILPTYYRDEPGSYCVMNYWNTEQAIPWPSELMKFCV